MYYGIIRYQRSQHVHAAYPIDPGDLDLVLCVFGLITTANLDHKITFLWEKKIVSCGVSNCLSNSILLGFFKRV